MHSPQKHLHIITGTHALLLSAHDILDIADYLPELCASSGSACQHHGKTVVWRDNTLPFVSLRQCLRLEAREPDNVVIVQGSAGEPLAMLAVDTVCGILTVEEDQLFHFEGIHAELNNLFDFLCVEKATGNLLMHLRPAAWWIPFMLQQTAS